MSSKMPPHLYLQLPVSSTLSLVTLPLALFSEARVECQAARVALQEAPWGSPRALLLWHLPRRMGSSAGLHALLQGVTWKGQASCSGPPGSVQVRVQSGTIFQDHVNPKHCLIKGIFYRLETHGLPMGRAPDCPAVWTPAALGSAGLCGASQHRAMPCLPPARGLPHSWVFFLHTHCELFPLLAVTSGLSGAGVRQPLSTCLPISNFMALSLGPLME